MTTFNIRRNSSEVRNLRTVLRGLGIRNQDAGCLLDGRNWDFIYASEFTCPNGAVIRIVYNVL